MSSCRKGIPENKKYAYNPLKNNNYRLLDTSFRYQNIIEKQSKWFNINHEKAYNALKFVFKNNFDMKRNAEKLRNKNIENFSMKIMTEKFNKIIEKYTSNLPSSVSLKLPKLKKLNKQKSSPIKLPKLKRV